MFITNKITMKKTLYTFVLIAFAFSMGVSQSYAVLTGDSSSDTAQDSPSSVNQNSSSNDNQDSGAGVVSSPSTDPNQDSNPSKGPEDNGGTPGGSTGGTRNRTSRSDTGSTGGLIAGATNGLTMTSCPIITEYLKLGGDNNTAQVVNLQVFLRDAEKLNVESTGIFDQKTEDAVKAFQKKYITDILGPWSATRATGFVYITTAKKINELACEQPLVLSADEVAIIEAYKQRGGNSADQNIGSVLDGVNATGTLQVGSTDGEDEENVAGAGGASILARFWAFIKSLFR